MENSSNSAHVAWLSLAVAAMVGATVAAASSYLIHCRTLDRLQSQKQLDLTGKRRGAARRRPNRDALSNATTVAPELMAHDNVKSVLNSSLPPRLPKNESTDSINTIPPGLPRVQVRKEGRSSNFFSHKPRLVLCFSLVMQLHSSLQSTPEVQESRVGFSGSDEFLHGDSFVHLLFSVHTFCFC